MDYKKHLNRLVQSRPRTKHESFIDLSASSNKNVVRNELMQHDNTKEKRFDGLILAKSNKIAFISIPTKSFITMSHVFVRKAYEFMTFTLYLLDTVSEVWREVSMGRTLIIFRCEDSHNLTFYIKRTVKATLWNNRNF